MSTKPKREGASSQFRIFDESDSSGKFNIMKISDLESAFQALSAGVNLLYVCDTLVWGLHNRP